MAELIENIVLLKDDFDSILQRNYGNKTERGLELSIVEALYLLEKKKIEIKKGRIKLDFEKFFKKALKIDKRLRERYIVFRDLRDKGLVTKTGFKFGCDFRVYRRGVSVKKGPKSAAEHTKWIVFAVPEDYICSFQELSRAVRLAHSIRATMLWAIVDADNNVTYFEVVRKTL